MEQIGRSATHETWGYLHPCRYVLHDRDTKFCVSFRSVPANGGVNIFTKRARRDDRYKLLSFYQTGFERRV